MLMCAIFQFLTRKKQTKIDCIENVNEVISIFWEPESAPSQAANLCVLSLGRWVRASTSRTCSAREQGGLTSDTSLKESEVNFDQRRRAPSPRALPFVALEN